MGCSPVVRASLTGKATAAVAGLAALPGLVNEVLGLVNSALPGAPPGVNRSLEGELLASQMPAWLDRLTILGRLAQKKYQLHKAAVR